MKEFIAYEKLSKKRKREMDRQNRRGFGDVNPVSRRKESAKLYSRKKARRMWETNDGAPFLCRKTVWNVRYKSVWGRLRRSAE